jgi:hypothetical protein
MQKQQEAELIAAFRVMTPPAKRYFFALALVFSIHSEDPDPPQPPPNPQ